MAAVLKKRIFTLESCGIVPAGNSHDQFPKSSRAIGVVRHFQPLKSQLKPRGYTPASIPYTRSSRPLFRKPVLFVSVRERRQRTARFLDCAFHLQKLLPPGMQCPSCGFNISSISIRSVPSFEYAFVSSVFFHLSYRALPASLASASRLLPSSSSRSGYPDDDDDVSMRCFRTTRSSLVPSRSRA